VALEPELLTVADLDSMTPNERAQAVNARVVMTSSKLPPAFRASVIATAERVADELKRTTGECHGHVELSALLSTMIQPCVGKPSMYPSSASATAMIRSPNEA
jgi:hypothetical protein